MAILLNPVKSCYFYKKFSNKDWSIIKNVTRRTHIKDDLFDCPTAIRPDGFKSLVDIDCYDVRYVPYSGNERPPTEATSGDQLGTSERMPNKGKNNAGTILFFHCNNHNL